MRVTANAIDQSIPPGLYTTCYLVLAKQMGDLLPLVYTGCYSLLLTTRTLTG